MPPVVLCVSQGTVPGPFLSLLHINDITADIDTEIRLFADDFVCYREIKDKEDTLKLQRDVDRLGNWARKWGMRIQSFFAFSSPYGLSILYMSCFDFRLPYHFFKFILEFKYI